MKRPLGLWRTVCKHVPCLSSSSAPPTRPYWTRPTSGWPTAPSTWGITNGRGRCVQTVMRKVILMPALCSQLWGSPLPSPPPPLCGPHRSTKLWCAWMVATLSCGVTWQCVMCTLACTRRPAARLLKVGLHGQTPLSYRASGTVCLCSCQREAAEQACISLGTQGKHLWK